MRTVPEWIGKNDDAAIPPRVRKRIFDRTNGHCAACTRELRAGQWECDHIIPLILGGRHAESNLQPLCSVPCHSAKTARDVRLRAKVEHIRKREIGIKKPSRFPCSRNSRFKKKITGEVVFR
jgi:5-methylcytosine-specific restriction endonuclease McrA